MYKICYDNHTTVIPVKTIKQTLYLLKTTTQILYLLRQACKRQTKKVPSIWYYIGEK